MKILVKKVDEEPFVKEVDKLELKDMQKLVGGYIERIGVGGKIDLWCNDEGKLLGLPTNIFLGDSDTREIYDSIQGDIFFASYDDEGNTIGLSDGEITWATNQLTAGRSLITVDPIDTSRFGIFPVWHLNSSIT